LALSTVRARVRDADGVERIERAHEPLRTHVDTVIRRRRAHIETDGLDRVGEFGRCTEVRVAEVRPARRRERRLHLADREIAAFKIRSGALEKWNEVEILAGLRSRNRERAPQALVEEQ